MATLGTTSKPAYVYDTETDTWVPIGVGAHTHALTSADVSGVVAQSGYFAAGKNKIINGDFGVWQRGATVTAGTYTADRWVNTGGSGTVSRQAFTPGTAPVAGYESQYYMNWTITADQINNEMLQRIENARTFAGQTVTLSFWARSTAGAQPLNVALYQYFGTGGSPSSLTGATLISGGSPYTPTASWQRFTFTFTVPSVNGKTFGTNNDSFLWVRPAQFTNTTTNTSLDIWGVQLEAGSVATSFSTATGNPASELAACQRYYFRFTAENSATAFFGSATNPTTTQGNAWVQYPVTMRTKPTSVDSSSLCIREASGTRRSMSSIVLETNGTNANLAFIYGTISNATVNIPAQLTADNTTSAYIGFNAEL